MIVNMPTCKASGREQLQPLWKPPVKYPAGTILQLGLIATKYCFPFRLLLVAQASYP